MNSSAPITVCASYTAGDQLFEISGLTGKLDPVPNFVANTFSVLTRGAPTKPTRRLLESLAIDPSEHLSEHLCLLPRDFPTWENTILGGDDGYNPALEFFLSLPEVLGDWGFVAKLMIPEYPLFKRLNADPRLTADGRDENVDFYLPLADLVIEIDGSQHQDKEQRRKDKSRDQFLKRFGILTLRLTTADFRSQGQAYSEFIEALFKRFATSQRLIPYYKFNAGKRWNEPDPTFELAASIRLNIAVIMAISSGQLQIDAPEWVIIVTQDFQSRDKVDWVKSSFDELFSWLSLFARIRSCDFTPPKIVFKESGVRFDLQLLSRPDGTAIPENTIFIRTSSVQDHPFLLDNGPNPRIARLNYYGLSHLQSVSSESATQPFPSIEDITELAKLIFGHTELRPGQDTLILNALSGQKSLGLMPTGGGKSLCFQLPALIGNGVTIVVVPIKALGRDHRAELEAVGFTGRVVNIDSDTPTLLREKAYRHRILRGDFRFVFVSPERFQTKGFREIVSKLVQTNTLQMMVIDEVHCMSEWGHDFRPSYLTLPGTLRILAPDAMLLGLTATASVNVLKDIQNEFEIDDELVAYEMHRSRTELNFAIREGNSAPAQIAKEVHDLTKPGIGGQDAAPVHVFTRYANGGAGVITLAAEIARHSPHIRVGFFSGSKPKEYKPETAASLIGSADSASFEDYEAYKRNIQELWKRNELDVIVTTKAFGMGVNKPNVRHTLHAGMPSSMEAFYQEAGRAGRDRLPAYCHMLLKQEPDDVSKIFSDLKDNITPERLDKKINDVPRSARGDFRAQLWFLRQGVESLARERDQVLAVMRIVFTSPSQHIDIDVGKLGLIAAEGLRLQITLYRLYQMGLIKPWLVTDWGRELEESSVQAVQLEPTHISFQDACDNVIARIRAIDGAEVESPTIEKLFRLRRSSDGWQALTETLILWVHHTHVGSRLQSTWNLYKASTEFKDENADEFRETLEAFFKVDSSAFQLASLRDMAFEDATAAVSELLLQDNGEINPERSKYRKLSAQLSRLLEGTQESRGLNLAYAYLDLIGGKGKPDEALKRLCFATQSSALENWNGSAKTILKAISASNESAREAIGSWLLADAPDRQTTLTIYEETKANVVAAALMDDLSQSITEML